MRTTSSQRESAHPLGVGLVGDTISPTSLRCLGNVYAPVGLTPDDWIESSVGFILRLTGAQRAVRFAEPFTTQHLKLPLGSVVLFNPGGDPLGYGNPIGFPDVPKVVLYKEYNSDYIVTESQAYVLDADFIRLSIAVGLPPDDREDYLDIIKADKAAGPWNEDALEHLKEFLEQCEDFAEETFSPIPFRLGGKTCLGIDAIIKQWRLISTRDLGEKLPQDSGVDPNVVLTEPIIKEAPKELPIKPVFRYGQVFPEGDYIGPPSPGIDEIEPGITGIKYSPSVTSLTFTVDDEITDDTIFSDEPPDIGRPSPGKILELQLGSFYNPSRHHAPVRDKRGAPSPHDVPDHTPWSGLTMFENIVLGTISVSESGDAIERDPEMVDNG
jgi:hypothetical protein